MNVSNFKIVEYKLIQCMCPNYRYCACNFDFVHWPCSKLEIYTSIWQHVFAIHYTGKIQIGIYTAFLFIVSTHISLRLRRLQKALCEILVMQFLFNILKREECRVSVWRASTLSLDLNACFPVSLFALKLIYWLNSFSSFICLQTPLSSYLPCKYIPAVCTSFLPYFVSSSARLQLVVSKLSSEHYFSIKNVGHSINGHCSCYQWSHNIPIQVSCFWPFDVS